MAGPHPRPIRPAVPDRPPRRRDRAAWAGFLFGAGSIGDVAAGGLPPRPPRRRPRGAAADLAGFAADARKLCGDGRRAVRRVIPAEVIDAADAAASS